jgi:hypothetical protein
MELSRRDYYIGPKASTFCLRYRVGCGSLFDGCSGEEILSHTMDAQHVRIIRESARGLLSEMHASRPFDIDRESIE